MRILSTSAKWLFVLCLPFFLLTASIAIAVNNQWLYEYGIKKYGVSQTTGLAEVELKKAAGGLIGYFNSSTDLINVTVIKDGQPFVLFNEREVSHLKDVKDLFQLDYRVLLGTLLYLLAYAGVRLFWRQDRRQLAQGLAYGSGLTLILMLTLGLLALTNFDQFFLQFHLLSFANELWMLDPTKDYLIMMFPRGFWYDATLFIAVEIVVGAVVLGGVGVLLLRRP